MICAHSDFPSTMELWRSGSACDSSSFREFHKVVRSNRASFMIQEKTFCSSSRISFPIFYKAYAVVRKRVFEEFFERQSRFLYVFLGTLYLNKRSPRGCCRKEIGAEVSVNAGVFSLAVLGCVFSLPLFYMQLNS